MFSQPSSSSASSSSSIQKMKKRRWTREQLLNSLEILGPLAAPLPPDLPPSPPASRSNSLSPPKRKHESTQESDVVKRSRLTGLPEKPSSHHHHHYHPPAPPPPPPQQPIRSSNQVPSFNLRSEPSEDGEVREDTNAVTTRGPAPAVLSTTVPVRRPRRGRPAPASFDEMHDIYHKYGRMLKYSGDARFWSTYPATHKEYRPLANPPPPNSPYHKHGGLIARLELVDALVCFTYSLWSKDFSRKSCFRETWATIEAFLGWCKNKWIAELDTIGDREKALLGLIWMIEGFIHGRKFFFSAKMVIEPEMERTWAKMKADMAALSKEAEKAEMNGMVGSAGQLSLGSQPTPPMLPSPASIAPANSANSTPINSSASGTPNASSSSSNTSLANSSAPSRPAPPISTALPQYMHGLLPQTTKGQPASYNMVEAAAKATATIGPVVTYSVKELSGGVMAAGYCMEYAQRTLTLPILARHYPTTFARMMSSSLTAHEEHEPDIEDEEGELFWPGQCVTGEGLGWVCLMGKAMIKEFGRDIGYLGLAGVVPKPAPGPISGDSSRHASVLR
ncbi:uncharacterized protein EDB91DRAFT_612236 [Suillus paluster]|uniref:uncharacterized protein n=1 Tax=Suillus paluster TaxID=48578 RepID=UPI001B878333|nr:uncharacterized protein EDB91DRAFT_612236 [Suillus paluster]KAG1751543.1 hypothetical protein EDB91DRAFT_612236 [Suillus paluster]